MSLKLIGQSHRSTTFYFSKVWTAVGQTADRLIKPRFRDPSLKPTKQIKDKDGERQIVTGWGGVEV